MIAPEIRRWVALVAVVVALIFTGLILAWCAEGRKADKAAGEASVAAAQSSLGKSASDRADAVRGAEEATDDLTQSNTDFIEGATNADQDAGDAGNRGRLAYCNRERVRANREPAWCAELRRSYPE